MKKLNSILILMMSAYSFSAYAIDELAPLSDIIKKEMKIEEIPNNGLLPEGCFDAEPSNDKNLFDANLSTDKMKMKGSLMVVPYSQQFAYINGILCHVGYYNDCAITTVLEGFHYGKQVVSRIDGALLVNPYYNIDYTPNGMFLRHEYHDSTVITGQDQLIVLYY